MIYKKDIIRFVEEAQIKKLESAVVIVTDDKGACYQVDGRQTQVAAALILAAREAPYFKEVLIMVGAYLDKEGGENGTKKG